MSLSFVWSSCVEIQPNQFVVRYVPKRTLILAVGHDEEIGGRNGARCMNIILEKRGMGDFQLVIDEGGIIVEDGFGKLFADPIALIGTSQKVTLGSLQRLIFQI